MPKFFRLCVAMMLISVMGMVIAAGVQPVQAGQTLGQTCPAMQVAYGMFFGWFGVGAVSFITHVVKNQDRY